MIPLPPFGHCPKKHTIWYLQAPKYNSHLMVMMMTVLTMLWRLHSGWGRLGEEEVGGGGSGWILVSSLLPLHQSAIWAPPASLRQQPPASSPVTTNWAISYFLFCFGLYLASIRSIPIPFHHLQLFPLSLKNEKLISHSICLVVESCVKIHSMDFLKPPSTITTASPRFLSCWIPLARTPPHSIFQSH